MYRYLIRPILFLIPPETIHKLIVIILKWVNIIPGSSDLLQKLFINKRNIANITFCGLQFNSPVGLAAGFDKNADFYNEFSSFGFGFIEIGTVTPYPQPGNAKPRSFRLKQDSALINRMGFNNKGADYVVNNLKKARKKGLIIGGNIGKNTSTPNNLAADDYEICFGKLYDYVDYFVVNVSCPNISNLSELQDPKALEEILIRLVNHRKQRSVYKPVLLKISPDLTFQQIDEIIEIYYKTKIDGIVATNTSINRNNLKTGSDKVQRIGKGGLSGKPLTERATSVIRYISEKSEKRIPIIGVGGIMTPRDAIEKIEAGASLIQIYTGFIYEGPFIVKRINKALNEMKRN
ncbi:MAG: quinone-dependent dihydroorotate dehydrogenase [Bacteroidales bacterium]|nr:quinone-dependent dihydroorotate dehydrogenase [Bacteroidales bacterium]